jgi:hypothetical protein
MMPIQSIVRIPGASKPRRVLRKRFSSATTLEESWILALG